MDVSLAKSVLRQDDWLDEQGSDPFVKCSPTGNRNIGGSI